MNRKILAKKFWDRGSFLNVDNLDYRNHLVDFLDLKIKEDVQKEDVTANILIDDKKKAKAVLKAKEKCVVCGLEEVAFFLKLRKFDVKKFKNDGDFVSDGEVVLEIGGNARDVLGVERTILNLIQRMSGIATKTSQLNKKIKKKCFILGTRKAILDYFDKKAIFIGGGLTHRLNLGDSILIKDNHLKLLGNDIGKAITLASRTKKPIEIEVKNEEEALVASNCLSKIKNESAIMFDNMSPNEIRGIIQKIRKMTDKTILFEASGGITEANIAEYAKSCVDALSMGSLTHSVKACDFSLKIQ